MATPLAFEVDTILDSVPWSALKVTGIPATPCPFASRTTALSSTVPPEAGTLDGLARTVTVLAAAAPIGKVTTLVAVDVALAPFPAAGAVPPAAQDVARTSAMPEVLPA